MLILLDENLLIKKMKNPLLDVGHSVQNVENMGWRGVKDQGLLALAEAHPFDVFITAEQRRDALNFGYPPSPLKNRWKAKSTRFRVAWRA